jgi:photosystem II stability/assembly factor-like uncharacterized protein
VVDVIRLACIALVVAGCGGSPHWSLPLAALDRVPLSVHQNAPHDVWIVGGALGSGGNALALHYDGSTWRASDLGTDATMWWVAPASPTQVWMVGERGSVFLGPPFSTVSVPTMATLYGVWSSGGETWIVGGEPDLSGVVLHNDGSGWRDRTPAGTTSAFFKVWGSSKGDVFICGQGGVMLHWDGATLAPQPTGLGRNMPLFTVAGRAANDVWAVGGLGNAAVIHFGGSVWSTASDAVLTDAPGLAGVSVDGDGTVAMVGAGGAKFRGRAGALVDESAQATRDDLHAVSLVNGELFTVGGNYQAPPGAPRQGVVAHFGSDISSTIK